MPIGSRQTQCAGVAAVLVAAAVACGSCGGRPRTNVLLLVMDTTRADRCSFQGYARPTTPRLDEFAKESMTFRNAWSPANWTGPAHASLFTGLRPETHGFNGDARPNLAAGRATLAERFAAEGYETACFTNNEFVSPEFGLTRGFAKYEPLFQDEHRTYPWAPATHARAAEWAESAHAAGRPFFLFINDTEPHQPYTPPEADTVGFLRNSPTQAEIDEARRFTRKESLRYDLGLADVGPRRLALLSDLYDGEVRTLDRAVGELLDRLRTDGLLDSTLVVIVGDHGEFLGEHRILDHGFGLYRQVLHVPLILRFPGTFDGGRVVPSVVRLEDVPPTLLEVCGLPPLPSIDGVPLTRDLSGRVARAMQGPRDLITFLATKEFPDADRSRLETAAQSVFDGERHLIATSDGRAELFDVLRDPDELVDVSASEPGEVARLRGLLPPPR